MTSRAADHTSVLRQQSSTGQCRFQHPRHVQGAAARTVLNLVAAARAIGHDHCVCRRFAQRRQQHSLAHRLRNRIFILFDLS